MKGVCLLLITSEKYEIVKAHGGVYNENSFRLSAVSLETIFHENSKQKELSISEYKQRVVLRFYKHVTVCTMKCQLA